MKRSATGIHSFNGWKFLTDEQRLGARSVRNQCFIFGSPLLIGAGI